MSSFSPLGWYLQHTWTGPEMIAKSWSLERSFTGVSIVIITFHPTLKNTPPPPPPSPRNLYLWPRTANKHIVIMSSCRFKFQAERRVQLLLHDTLRGSQTSRRPERIRHCGTQTNRAHERKSTDAVHAFTHLQLARTRLHKLCKFGVKVSNRISYQFGSSWVHA